MHTAGGTDLFALGLDMDLICGDPGEDLDDIAVRRLSRYTCLYIAVTLFATDPKVAINCFLWCLISLTPKSFFWGQTT